MIETFADSAASRWRFFSDEVTGGVSYGALRFGNDDDHNWAQMKGMVSTESNGGFSQMQHRLGVPRPANVVGIGSIARGNDQRCFINLRRNSASNPTAFYRAGFKVTSKWRDVHLPFIQFTASNIKMPAVLEGASVASVAVVAYGYTSQKAVARTGQGRKMPWMRGIAG